MLIKMKMFFLVSEHKNFFSHKFTFFSTFFSIIENWTFIFVHFCFDSTETFSNLKISEYFVYIVYDCYKKKVNVKRL
jgi:hypothetical protein